MSRSIKLYLDDILASINKIQKYTAQITLTELLEDEKTLDAVIFNLQIIGEASKKIPENIRQEQAQIPWKNIMGLRNLIAHVYFSLDYEIIWDIINTKLDDLKNCVEIMIQDENII